MSFIFPSNLRLPFHRNPPYSPNPPYNPPYRISLVLIRFLAFREGRESREGSKLPGTIQRKKVKLTDRSHFFKVSPISLVPFFLPQIVFL